VGPRPALATAGAVREFKVPVAGSHPGGITLGPDGAVWFTELATSGIGRLSAGTITSFPLPNGGEPVDIVSAPDGALWFTEASADRIGRITTSGQITEFDIPRCDGCTGVGPWDMTVGPDGALWFTEYEATAIGRIRMSGKIDQFPMGGLESDPTSITAGPDGALWFGDEAGIGRMTTGGTASQVWRGGSYASSITAGPDGNLWFVGGSQDVIGRLSPSSGKAKLFSIDLNCYPQQVTSGSGALWFTCYNLDEVGRVATSGVISYVPVPNHFNGNYPDTLEGIAAGRSHSIWFTEEAANRIGRISTS
jgi:streptogramin lyase